jgi:hypothetical protein
VPEPTPKLTKQQRENIFAFISCLTLSFFLFFYLLSDFSETSENFSHTFARRLDFALRSEACAQNVELKIAKRIN